MGEINEKSIMGEINEKSLQLDERRLSRQGAVFHLEDFGNDVYEE